MPDLRQGNQPEASSSPNPGAPHGLCGVCLRRRSSDPVRASRSGDDAAPSSAVTAQGWGIAPATRRPTEVPETEAELREAWGK
jgi:hypothetical protein